MNRNPQDIKLLVTDWPTYCKDAEMSIDARLHQTVDAMRDWCRKRFGPGSLTELEDGSFRYERSFLVPKPIRDILRFVLNKSYV